MKKRVALIFTLAAVTCGIGFNTDYIKELLDLISQSAMEVVSYDKDNINGESTDSAVDKLGNELDNLSVDKFFGSTGEDESEIVSNTSNTENSQKTPSEMARSTQGTERYPGVDEFVDVVVKRERFYIEVNRMELNFLQRWMQLSYQEETQPIYLKD